MGDALHSSTWALVSIEEVSRPIQGAVAQLKEAFPKESLSIRRWNSGFHAVTLTVDVDLPSRGPVGGVDIRRREPIIVLFDEQRYPYVSPTIRSDRLDFPKTKFPHINPTAPGQPAYFCLHRGSLDAWFAEHSIVDLVHRGRGWLRDAARDRLVPERDGFERTIVANTTGTFVFDPRLFQSKVAEVLARTEPQRYRFVAYDLLDDARVGEIAEAGYVIRAASICEPSTLATHLELATLLNDLARNPETKSRFQRRLFGILLASPEGKVCSDHFGEIPLTLETFIGWAENLGLQAREAFDKYLAENLYLFAGVPVTIAVRRPSKIIGTDFDVELLSFLILADDEHKPIELSWNPETKVLVSDHRAPLTPSFAKHLSSHPLAIRERALLIGCGALGSKIAVHLARSGDVGLHFVDHSVLSPHNLVRHSLGGEQVGQKKAVALEGYIKKLFPGVPGLQVTSESANGMDLLTASRAGELGQFPTIVDATASVVFLNALCEFNEPINALIARTEIGDKGNLGLLSIEGRDRNPRLDDLQSMIFDWAIEESSISRWLVEVQKNRIQEVGSGLEEIQIGLSCSSATMRLADETVAFHATNVVRRLRSATSATKLSNDGLIFRSSLFGEEISSASRAIDKVEAFRPENDPSWEIRISGSAASEMRNLMIAASPSETGGLLIGRINPKRRIVYITRLMTAPRDSKGSPFAFQRGIYKLPDAIQKIEESTGGLLGYVGEWHSHPLGGSKLSEVDDLAVARLRSVLDPVSLPTLITIVTPGGIHPHFFEPGKSPIFWPAKTSYFFPVQFLRELFSKSRKHKKR